MAARRAIVVGAVIVIASAAVAVAVAVWRARPPSTAPAAPSVARSVVVLPLQTTFEGRHLPWHSFAVAQELATALTSIPGLRVAPTPSQLRSGERRGDELRFLAAELNVSAVLQGSWEQDANEGTLRLRLTQASNDSTIWTATFTTDSPDVHDLIDKAAKSIANGLGAQPGVSIGVTTRDHLAHLFAFRAAYVQTRGDRAAIDTAVLLLEQAVRRDSSYARAWSALAALLVASDSAIAPPVQAKATAAARRAIALDGTLAEPHLALARVHAMRRDTTRAVGEYLMAIALDPQLATARYEYSRLLSAMGRTAEAAREARRAHELDPLDAEVHLNYAQMLARAGSRMEAQHEMADLRRINRYLLKANTCDSLRLPVSC